MGRATIPVDLRNPGQVFACLGLMEAADILFGEPCTGAYLYADDEIRTQFQLDAPGSDDPVRDILRFLSQATVTALAPKGSGLRAQEEGVPTRERQDDIFPAPCPDTPSALSARLSVPGGNRAIPLEHWQEGDAAGRDTMKFWAGAGGYSGAALTRDALALIQALGDNALAEAAADPFDVSAPQSSSFRFDWRRDYIPMEVGFSPNAHGAVTMIGFPLVELLAAIGLQNARPRPESKLSYVYGVSNAPLPTLLARAVLGGQNAGVPYRRFRMHLGWPGQEGQARCIIDAQEESVP